MGSVDMANDLEALRMHLGLSEISILGHSNSGAIALAYAVRYPVLIDSQVLGLSAVADTQRILQDRSTDPRLRRPRELCPHFSKDSVAERKAVAPGRSLFHLQPNPSILYTWTKTL